MPVTKKPLKSLVLLALGLSTVVAVESPDVLQLRSKAVRGNPVAQYTLARLFADEHSSNFDRAEAYVWFQLASENGATGKELAKLVDVMTPAELEQGKLRLKERREQIGAIAVPAPASAAPVQVPDDQVSKLQAERDQLIASLNATTAELAALKAGAPKPTGEVAQGGNSKLEAELNETRSAARQLAAKNQQLEDVASERGRALQTALTELEKAKANAQPTDQALVAVKADRDLLVKQLEDAQVRARKLAELPERVSRAERDAELLRSQSVKLGRELKEAQAKIAELSQAPVPAKAVDNPELAEKLSTAQRDLEALRSENTILAASLKDSQARAAELSQAAAKSSDDAALAEKLVAAQKTLAGLRGENASLLNALKENQARAEALEKAAGKAGENAVAQEKLAALQGELQSLSAKNSELSKRLEEAQSGQQDLAVLRERLSGEQHRAEELAASAAKLALDNERLRREAAGIGNTAAELGILRDKLAALEKQNAELAQRATAAETKLVSTPAQEAQPSDEFQKQLNESAEKLNTALRSYTVLQQELDQTKAAASQASAEYEARLTSAQSEIAALKGQLTSTSGESLDRANTLQAAQQEIQQLRSASLTQAQEVLALRDQLRQTLAQVSTAAEQNAQLKTKIAVITPPPGSTLAAPTRPGTAAAQAALVVQPVIQVPAQTTPKQHIIGDGDTLSKISRRYYGTPDRWNDIYQANRSILHDPSRLPKGAAIKLP